MKRNKSGMFQLHDKYIHCRQMNFFFGNVHTTILALSHHQDDIIFPTHRNYKTCCYIKVDFTVINRKKDSLWNVYRFNSVPATATTSFRSWPLIFENSRWHCEWFKGTERNQWDGMRLKGWSKLTVTVKSLLYYCWTTRFNDEAPLHFS